MDEHPDEFDDDHEEEPDLGATPDGAESGLLEDYLQMGLAAMHAPGDERQRPLPEYEYFRFFRRITPVLCPTREHVFRLNRKLGLAIGTPLWDNPNNISELSVIDIGAEDALVVVQLVASEDVVTDSARLAHMSVLAAHRLCRRESPGDAGPGMIARVTEEIHWHLLDQYYDHIQGFRQQLPGDDQTLPE
ncbi:MAG: hypothetical protein QMC94_05600 [Anaerosomatales bacterium]|nr:hypothetical protein [Anaerosomatales bacterium]